MMHWPVLNMCILACIKHAHTGLGCDAVPSLEDISLLQITFKLAPW